MPPFDDVPGVDLSGSEILVVNRSGPNPESYQRGDVVVVRPAGWSWGRLEDPVERGKLADAGMVAASPRDKFVILSIPGQAFAGLRYLGESWEKPHPDPLAPSEETVLEAKSRYRVDLDNLPGNVRNALASNGTAVVRWKNASRGHVLDKKAGTAVSDLGAA